MKKFLLLVTVCISAISCYGQDADIKSLYAYHISTVLDRDFNVLKEIPSSTGDPIGIFGLAKYNEKDYITITLGHEPLYEIQVVNFVKGDVENGIRIDMFQGGMYVEEQIAVINVFLEYNIERNDNIPEAITIDVYKSPNYIRLSGLIPVHK